MRKLGLRMHLNDDNNNIQNRFSCFENVINFATKTIWRLYLREEKTYTNRNGRQGVQLLSYFVWYKHYTITLEGKFVDH